jgi:hypothetical protein
MCVACTVGSRGCQEWRWTVSDQNNLVADPGMLTLARDSRGWTQSDLADQMSRMDGNRITQGYVSRAEAGRIPVKGERDHLFADALRYTPAMLCRATDIAGAVVGLVHHRQRASMGPRSASNPCNVGTHPPPGRQ